MKTWYEANRDWQRAQSKAWSQANPDRVKANSRAWVQANPEKRREIVKRYYNADLEKSRAKSREARALRRARMQAVEIEMFTRQEVWERDAGICGICGEVADPNDWQLDHIIPIVKQGPHTLANVQVAHPRCNRQKGVA